MPNNPNSSSRKQQFGRRKDVHRIIIAKGDKVTSVTIHPFLAAVGVTVAATFAVAYLGATGYLMFRDDILNASHIRQVRLQNAYEDQMASLRIEIDRIASRQMLDQKSVESKIDRLLGLRASLDERKKSVDSLVKTASAAGIRVQTSTPEPRPHPARKTDHASIIDQNAVGSINVASAYGQTRYSSQAETAISQNLTSLDPSSLDLNKIERNLETEEITQVHQLRLVAKKTVDKAKNIASVLRSLGAKASSQLPNNFDAVGGPFEEATHVDTVTFNSSILALEENLTFLNKLKKRVKRFPLAKPLTNGKITSRFGRRVDPFLRRYANHSGMDFKAATGTPVLATGPGKVIKASWQGGYGRLVEIKHTGGITTRYAHLSRIHVKVGEYVTTGKRIGRVGSTGRSTGPHLHYETRVSNRAVNPDRFIKAGARVSNSL
ncbi:MAG: M23 family metallopeptidase [Hyphomicrobiales bacterium]